MDTKKKAINRQTIKDRLYSYRKHPGSFVLALLTVAAAVITVCVLLFLVIYILVKGIPYLKPDLLHGNTLRTMSRCFRRLSIPWK